MAARADDRAVSGSADSDGSLPVPPPAPVAPPPSGDPTPMPRGDTFTILLLEDSASDRLLVRAELEGSAVADMRIIEAARLSDAFEVLRGRRIDLVLTDLNLPDASGFATVDKLREHAPEVPIIVLTGQRDEQLAAEVLHRGVQDYLVKGRLGEHMLQRTIRSAIERHRFTAELGRYARALAASERRFRDYAETASDWFWETDADHRLTFLSERVRHFGMVPEQRLGKRRADLILVDYGDGDQELRAKHLALLNRHEPFRNASLKTRAEDGSVRTICLSGNPVFSADGSFLGYRGSARDDTERLLTEQRLHESQKLDAVGQLTGGVAHDFNNLLTVVLGNLALVRRQECLDGETAHSIDAAYQAASRGAELVSRLLTFSRQQVLEPTVIDLNQAVERIVPLIRRTIGEHIEVHLDKAPEPLTAKVDSAQLESGILNLCLNARDAMPESGGRIIIETRSLWLDGTEETGPGETKGGRFVAVAVSDTGAGMTAEVRARVLEPFFTTKERGKGTGLGLSMVFGFVKQSGGQLTIDSEVGRGTAVRMLFPFVAAERAAARTRADNRKPLRIARKVVLVEDDDEVRAVLLAMLKSLGCEVAVAANAASALELMSGLDQVDVLVSDVIMPGGMSGIDLAKEVRKTRPRLKILFSSGYADIQDRSDLGTLEGIAWIAKPYDVRKLGQKLQKLLEE